MIKNRKLVRNENRLLIVFVAYWIIFLKIVLNQYKFLKNILATQNFIEHHPIRRKNHNYLPVK